MNHLERVAASSARTSAPLRAPATPPPLMPEFPSIAMPEAPPEASAELPGLETPEGTMPVPVVVEPAKAAAPPTVVRHEEGAAKKPAPAAPAPSLEKPSSTPRPQADEPPQFQKPPSLEKTVVQAPRLWARSRGPEQAGPMGGQQRRSLPATNVPSKPQPLRTEVQWPRLVAAPAPPPPARDTPAAPQEPTPARVAIAAAAPRTEAPAAAPARPPLRRESRIHIGRVDVRVNNTPAVPQPRPAKASPPALNWLETRYLSRFPFRP